MFFLFPEFHYQDLDKRRKFVLKLAKALLTFGAPSHRIESQLHAASKILSIQSEFVHLPNLIIVAFHDGGTRASETHFVRASGRIALTSLHKVHLVYRHVLHDKLGAEAGTSALRKILRAPPRYNLFFRCALSFVSASILCSLAFGGSLVDMLVGGFASAVLQFLGLQAAAKSAIYANVYEISISILMSFLARGLSTLPDNLFCYSAIASTGVASVLPGFTVLISALELTSANVLCGSVRMVYAIIYTLFLGFGLTIGSELFLAFSPHARNVINNPVATQVIHGQFMSQNGSTPFLPLGGTFSFGKVTTTINGHMVSRCLREPYWPWYRQVLPWWSIFFFVPIYSTCSSLANLQSWKSKQLLVMVLFSSASYAANKSTGMFISTRGDIVSALGAFVIGALGNIYSRVIRGTAFTSMVTGVLFLVPVSSLAPYVGHEIWAVLRRIYPQSALGQDGGIIQSFQTSSQQYSTGFSLGLRMIQIAVGVTVGLFASQIVVYSFGTRKNAAYFAF
ncbi:hypothetical protein JAAARDRAFT_376354 [Jaapia argillacea MUCL 33604]|uniref:Threonine/serine exporter-like N-terminal domain-containing protein n=1 Tax=Jaapia argillacea MUCL 33604 TaxID=933084 RepID=A0A067QIN3_9AGAM|nr:hypothetical protein JAAARDRAFT_376354 [Jaapia argillacea MUCL 33604]